MSLLQQLSGKLRRLQWTGLNSFNYHYILISHFCAVESIFEHDSRGSSTQLKWLVRTQQGNRSALFPCFVVSFSQKRSKKWELVRAKKIPQCCDTLSLANDVASGLLGIKGTVMPCCCPVSWYRLWLVSAQPSSGRGHFIVSRDTGYIISWKKGVCELSFWQLFFFFYFPSTCFFYVWSKKSDLSCFCFACCENLSHILGLSFAPQLFPQLSWVEDAGMCENRFQGSPQPETWLAEEFRTRGVRLFRTCLLVGFLFCVTVSSSARFCLCVLISFWFGFANDSAFHFF